MKKSIAAFTLFLFFGLNIYAGGAKFEQKMGETLAKFQSAQSFEDFRAVANQFQMIARAEKDEWLPRYYHAHIYILMSFMSQEGAEAKDALLDVAEASVEEMLKLVPKESEAYALQGFLYTGRLVVDPASRGQQYSMLSQQSIGRALGMNPENPRARYLKLANDMGMAQHFGSDPAPLCAKAQELLAGWDDYKAASRLHPQWGKAQVAEMVQTCNQPDSE